MDSHKVFDIYYQHWGRQEIRERRRRQAHEEFYHIMMEGYGTNVHQCLEDIEDVTSWADDGLRWIVDKLLEPYGMSYECSRSIHTFRQHRMWVQWKRQHIRFFPTRLFQANDTTARFMEALLL